jgi:CheY-like chemotaxis protein
MACILSVSYDPSLLETRENLLELKGYSVSSAGSVSEALEYCNSGAPFDLFILGHSIPNSDKETLMKAFRSNSSAPIIALKRGSEMIVRGADIVIEPDPHTLLSSVASLLAGKSTAA